MQNLNKFIDHTNLKPSATRADIEKLCAEARAWDFASVCVNPCNIALCKELLAGSDVMTCTVIGFPLGQNTTAVKVAETEDAYALGCDEFDMVINVGKLKDGALHGGNTNGCYRVARLQSRAQDWAFPYKSGNLRKPTGDCYVLEVRCS